MNTIRQHIPGCCEGIEPQTATFNTLNELLNIPFVKKHKILSSLDFYQFSISKSNHRYTLMVELNDGYVWYVVGFLENDVVELPRFKSKSRSKYG